MVKFIIEFLKVSLFSNLNIMWKIWGEKKVEKKIYELKTKALQEINNAENFKLLAELKTKHLGKKSELFFMLKEIKNINNEDRKKIGNLLNQAQMEIKEVFNSKFKLFKEKDLEEKMKKQKIDVTLPGKDFALGSLHPLTKTLNKILEIFVSLGYGVVSGPEIETDYYNFEALNIPKNHPARDTQDTFYISKNTLLRSQTSPVQIRIMEKTNPPIKIISPGRVYRADEIDATHSPMFHQVEGLLVDKNISMANLKATLEHFVAKLFEKNVSVRFRPHHFPFTEPSAEMDISCFRCDGKGCSLCKNEGFIEILGCGMVHPNVLKKCNINPDEYSGFAFGLGLERIVMLEYEINDLRLFFENDLRFLKQF